MEPEPVKREPFITFDSITIATLALIMVGVTGALQIISVDSAIGVIGLGVLAMSIGTRDIGVTGRMISVISGLGILAYGGWLDFEGWRFLPPRGQLGGT
ncbi:MAG: hypothetical protein Q8R35_02310, partial [bacterium]|nr:hypothetical protein [bacterium]